MTHTLWAALTASIVGLIGRLPWKRQSVFFQVSNLTSSGGDRSFSVVDNVTFENLSLIETFEDGTVRTVALSDPSTNMELDCLDAGTVLLTSASFQSPDPTHGRLTSATLSGRLRQTSLTIQSGDEESSQTVTVHPQITAVLTQPGREASVLLCAQGLDGTAFAIGSLSLAPTAQVHEETTLRSILYSDVTVLFGGRQTI